MKKDVTNEIKREQAKQLKRQQLAEKIEQAASSGSLVVMDSMYIPIADPLVSAIVTVMTPSGDQFSITWCDRTSSIRVRAEQVGNGKACASTITVMPDVSNSVFLAAK